MTVPATSRLSGPYTADGTTTTFPFSFKVLGSVEGDQPARPRLFRADGTEVSLQIETDYTVAIHADQESTPGGSVTFTSPPEAPLELVIVGDVVFGQPTALPDGGAYRARTVEGALDRLAVQIQQENEELRRALRLSPLTPSGVDAQLPPPAAGQVVGWNESATSLVNLNRQDFVQFAAFVQWKYEEFLGDAVITEWELDASPGALNNLTVWVNGVIQRAGVDYTYDHGAVFTTTTAVPDGERMIVRYGQVLDTNDLAQTEANRIAAANSATAASTSETNASNSATAASTSATNASNSATAAAGSASAAGTDADRAEAAATELVGAPVPLGTVASFATSTAPDGWLVCNGTAVGRATYPDLFTAVGTAFGDGDGSTTFNLPDLRGEFVRGSDEGRGVDTGRVLGSAQFDQMQRITGGGIYNFVNASGASMAGDGALSTVRTGADNMTTGGGDRHRHAISFDSADSPGARASATTDGETRPRNVALLFCIKAFASATNEGIVDVAGLATDVANLEANKLDKTDIVSPGTAPLYACRAWVNFNGTGTVAIRASGNVSSITDRGVGMYTVNFATALPDEDYASSFNSTTVTGGRGGTLIADDTATVVRTVDALNIRASALSSATSDAVPQDPAVATVTIFR